MFINDINRDLSSSIRDAEDLAPIGNLAPRASRSATSGQRPEAIRPDARAADQLIACEMHQGLPGPAWSISSKTASSVSGHQQRDLDNQLGYINDSRTAAACSASAAARRAEDILNYNVKNSRSSLVPFSSLATKMVTRFHDFNYYPPCLRRGQTRLHLRRDAIAEIFAGKTAARLRNMNGPASESCRDSQALSPSRCSWCSLSGRTLDHSARWCCSPCHGKSSVPWLRMLREREATSISPSASSQIIRARYAAILIIEFAKFAGEDEAAVEDLHREIKSPTSPTISDRATYLRRQWQPARRNQPAIRS